MDEIKRVEGIKTKDTNMFNLHELQIDGVAVAYIRDVIGKLEVIPMFGLSVFTRASHQVNFGQELEEMIERFRKRINLREPNSSPRR